MDLLQAITRQHGIQMPSDIANIIVEMEQKLDTWNKKNNLNQQIKDHKCIIMRSHRKLSSLMLFGVIALPRHFVLGGHQLLDTGADQENYNLNLQHIFTNIGEEFFSQ